MAKERIELPKDVLKTLSKKYNLPVLVIDSIVRTQYKFISDTFKNKRDLTGIRLHNFGLFTPPTRVLEELKRVNEQQDLELSFTKDDK